jgi:hypothetical protein
MDLDLDQDHDQFLETDRTAELISELGLNRRKDGADPLCEGWGWGWSGASREEKCVGEGEGRRLLLHSISESLPKVMMRDNWITDGATAERVRK